MLNDIEFENQINELGDDQLALIKYVARQQFAASKFLAKHDIQIASHDIQIASLESGNRRASGITGGISGTIGAVIIMVINYFTGNNRS